jgi:ribonuclease VapC
VIIDTSAIIAILQTEPETAEFLTILYNAQSRRLAAPNFLEAAIVVERMGDPIAIQRLDDFIQDVNISIEPFTAEHARVARAAFRDFGRGSGHPARLNFGDCMAYALAKVMGEPLLFKGDDFSRTDIAAAH